MKLIHDSMQRKDDGLYSRVRIIPESLPQRDLPDNRSQLVLEAGRPPSQYIFEASKHYRCGHESMPASDLLAAGNEGMYWLYLKALSSFESACDIHLGLGQLLEGIVNQSGKILPLDAGQRESFEIASRKWNELKPLVDQISEYSLDIDKRTFAGFEASEKMLLILRDLGPLNRAALDAASELFDKAQFERLSAEIPELRESFQNKLDLYLAGLGLKDLIPTCRARLDATQVCCIPGSNRLTYYGGQTTGEFNGKSRVISLQLGVKFGVPDQASDYIEDCLNRNRATLVHESLHAASVNYRLEAGGPFKKNARADERATRIGFRVRGSFEWFNEGYVAYLQERFDTRASPSYLPSLATVAALLKAVPEPLLAATFFERAPDHARGSGWHAMQRELAANGYGRLLRKIDQYASSGVIGDEEFRFLCCDYPNLFNVQDLEAIKQR